MPKDLSHLPRASGSGGGGEPPLRNPHFGPVLAHAWRRTSMAEHAQRPPRQPMHPTYHSDAGKCSFALSLILEGVEPEPMDLTGYWNVSLGTLIHDHWQSAMTAIYGDRVIHEYVVGHYDGGVKITSGRIDSLLWLTGADMVAYLGDLAREGIEVVPQRDDVLLVAIETKSVGGFGFKSHVGGQGEAQGPMNGTVLQGALNALAVSADVLVCLDLAKECISEGVARKAGITNEEGRFVGEWAYTRPEYERLARAELGRLLRIRDAMAKGEEVPRYVPLEMPKGARITAPSSGKWSLVDDGQVVQAGSYWGCGYCSMRKTCIERNAERNAA